MMKYLLDNGIKKEFSLKNYVLYHFREKNINFSNTSSEKDKQKNH